MKKYNGLLAEIAREFHIEQGKTESGERWKARIIYSLLGRMAYASLNDHLEENEELPEDQSISVTHFKRRIITLLDTFCVSIRKFALHFRLKVLNYTGRFTMFT